MTFLAGLPTFLTSAAVVAGLSVIPPEIARWIAIGLLALLVVTPAVGRRVGR